ncbi:methyltransferase domain-containing protein [Ochrobactrum teleogrylli]|uniref:methyltransferase domain-containing protein n=1 Tax=Ochrobactrum teleogrylli TaxID=2479765 RepID=UPI00384ACBD2
MLVDFDENGVIERQNGYCPVCGHHTIFRSYAPLDFPCKRNDFVCRDCGSIGRNRHVALAILDEFKSRNFKSLNEFSQTFDGSIYITCVKEAVYRSLKGGRNVTSSEFIDGVPSGDIHNGILCQDLQQTTFPDDCFDLIVTEDVLEHVPDPKRAFAEIHRILKPGGMHIATIPVNWGREVTVPRARLVNGEVEHLMEPEYHGDPFRAEGVLAFTDYGQDIVSAYCAIIGRSKMLSAHGDKIYEQAFAIYNNWVFVSQKDKLSLKDDRRGTNGMIKRAFSKFIKLLVLAN